MSGFLLGIAVLLLIGIGFHLVVRADPATVSKVVRYGGATILSLAGLGLAYLGRFGFAVPLFIFSYWLIGRPFSRLSVGAEHAADFGASNRRRSTGPMTRAQACEILGVRLGADADEIQAAYRMLMQKLHPDHGGSTHLAAEVNAAKDFLLGE